MSAGHQSGVRGSFPSIPPSWGIPFSHQYVAVAVCFKIIIISPNFLCCCFLVLLIMHFKKLLKIYYSPFSNLLHWCLQKNKYFWKNIELFFGNSDYWFIILETYPYPWICTNIDDESNIIFPNLLMLIQKCNTHKIKSSCLGSCVETYHTYHAWTIISLIVYLLVLWNYRM